MPTTTLYINKFQRYFALGLTVLLLGGLVWFSTQFFSVPGTVPDLVMLVFFGVALCAIAGVEFFYFLVPIWQTRLEFGPATVTFKTISYQPAAPPWHMAYTDIRRVVYWPQLGQLWVVPHHGEAQLLPLTGFDGGAPALLAAFGRHLPAEQIQVGSDRLAITQQRMTWLMNGLVIAFMLVGMLYFYSTLGSQWLASFFAWQTSYPQPWLSRTAAFSLEPDGTAWLIVEDRNTYEVVRLRGDQTTRWPMPPANQWPALEFYNRPITVWGDVAGQPTVALPYGNLLHWDGHTWISHTAPTTYSIYYGLTMVAVEHELWVAGEPNTSPAHSTLLAIDPVSGAYREVHPPLPDPTADFQPWILAPATTGGLLVQASQGENEFLWHYAAGQWTTLAVWPTSSATLLKTVAVDSQQQVWTFNDDFDKPNQLGRFDAPTQTWQWVDLPREICCAHERESLVFSVLHVDRRGRFWIQTSQAIVVAALTPTNTLQLLARYTPENSNYQDSFDPRQLLGTDGRLWVADDRLVWIDTTAATLPEPLPAWLVLNQAQRTQGSIIYIVFLAAIYLPGQWFVNRQLRRARGALTKVIQTLP